MTVSSILDSLQKCWRIEDTISRQKELQGDLSGMTYHRGRRDALKQFAELAQDVINADGGLDGYKILTK